MFSYTPHQNDGHLNEVQLYTNTTLQRSTNIIVYNITLMISVCLNAFDFKRRTLLTEDLMIKGFKGIVHYMCVIIQLLI